ncbi:MAG TPA: amidohydrolase family protein [Solirubrobacteraceae bacterium]|nr:amidohydrolase family protein [Solirubrobacteraceae bacterium]
MDAIDCDVHCAPESFDALFPYLSDYWRQYITEAGVRLNGLTFAYPSAVVAAPAPSSYDALAEAVLIEAQARFVVLNCLTGFETHRNPYFAAAVASAVNDWMREEMLPRDSRLRASVVVSPVSPDDAVAEIERVGEDPRFVQVLLPVRSDLPWGHKNNHALFAAASERGLQVGLHAWGRAGKAATPSGFTTTYLEDYVGNQPIAQAQVLSFVSEGVFERFPDLRVVMIECGFAWLAPLLWRFDKDWKGVWREVPWIKRRPSEYVREHFRFTTAPAHLPSDPVVLDQLLEMLDGPGMLLYASDYPHRHRDDMPALLDRLTEEQRRGVLWATAAELYGTPVSLT